jgi:glycosyltransferase involved in cell wall biosynthesis
MLNLAHVFSERGHRVDLVLRQVAGPYLNQAPATVNVVELKASPGWLGRVRALSAEYNDFGALLLPVLLAYKPSRTLRYLPDLVRYLRREQPAALLSAKPYANLAALWARRLAGVPTRVVISERTSLSHEVTQRSKRWKWQFLPPVIRCVYPSADAIVAVSNGVADDLSLTAGIPREGITTIYNPVVMPELYEKARAPLNHPWFASGTPPVLLGAGRLVAQKDFATLIKAFARVRAVQEVRLVILGEGKKRTELETLTRELGVASDVDLPGWIDNPFAYMARAAVFVLSSAYEGLPGVLIQAMACGCPVVSTNCPSGPAEILENGDCGPLVPAGDHEALANAILSVLNAPIDRDLLRARAAMFSVDRAADQYLEVLLGTQKREERGYTKLPAREATGSAL